jgi:hypothetical protein
MGFLQFYFYELPFKEEYYHLAIQVTDHLEKALYISADVLTMGHIWHDGAAKLFCGRLYDKYIRERKSALVTTAI